MCQEYHQAAPATPTEMRDWTQAKPRRLHLGGQAKLRAALPQNHALDLWECGTVQLKKSGRFSLKRRYTIWKHWPRRSEVLYQSAVAIRHVGRKTEDGRLRSSSIVFRLPSLPHVAWLSRFGITWIKAGADCCWRVSPEMAPARRFGVAVRCLRSRRPASRSPRGRRYRWAGAPT